MPRRAQARNSTVTRLTHRANPARSPSTSRTTPLPRRTHSSSSRLRSRERSRADRRGQVDADLYRFTAKAGEQWVIEVNAARSSSKLDSFLEVLDSQGVRVPRVLLQAVRDSYFTFRGKDDTESGDFRVFNWQEMKLDEYLYSNGEVVKLWLYPRGPDSGIRDLSGPGKPLGLLRHHAALARAGRAVLHRRAPPAGNEARSQWPADLFAQL